jgi:general secretion pathway protein C
MRLKFDARARAILRRLPVVNIYSAAELALIAALAVQCARLAWVVLTPVSPLGAWMPAGPTVPADAAGVLAGFDPFYRVSGAQAQGPAVVTSLQLTLYGTRMDDAQARGAAIIAGPDGVQKSVAVGEEVAPGVVLKSVAFDHVTLERGGRAEDLFLDQSGSGSGSVAAPEGVPPPPSVPSPPLPPGTAPPDTMAGGPLAANSPSVSPQQLRSEISAIPRIESGKMNGVTVRGQGGTAFRAAGLRDGDVITSVAGREISSPADLEMLTRARASGGTLSLTVERGGQPLPLTIPVAR